MTREELQNMQIGEMIRYYPFQPQSNLVGYEKWVERVPCGWIYWTIQNSCGVPAGVFVPLD